MFGFLFGAACLGGLYLYLTREGHGRRHRGGGFRRRRRRFMMRRLFDTLDTTPQQEQVIEEAVRSLEQEGSEMRSQMRNGRFELSRVLRSDTLDREVLDNLSKSQESALTKLREQGLDAIARVHSVLDPRQRSLLADFFSGHEHPRGHHCWGRGWS